jgi:hypothetical protein
MACQTPLKRTDQESKPDPLILLNCPDLQPFENEKEITMGDLLLKYIQDTNQYYLCQASALKSKPKLPEEK